MSTTITYKGWVIFSPSRRGLDRTILLPSNRLFYRPRNNKLIPSICDDILDYGHYVNVRIWVSESKILPNKSKKLVKAFMGPLYAVYHEFDWLLRGNGIVVQELSVGDSNLLYELVEYEGRYITMDITYSELELDMISHEVELVLLRNLGL